MIRTFTTLSTALVLTFGLVGCDGDESSDAAPAKSDAELDDETVICCEFNGATGTSTEKKCAEFKGKVVDKKPPCT